MRQNINQTPLKVRLLIEVWHGSLCEEVTFGERAPRRDFPSTILSTQNGASPQMFTLSINILL